MDVLERIDQQVKGNAVVIYMMDVSGSMGSPNKLGLLKKSMKMLVAELGKDDRVAIVVYDGRDRIVLPSTS